MRSKIDTLFIGVALFLVGGLFLLENYGILDFDFWQLFVKFWPLILIYIGLKNIILNLVRKK